MMMKYRLLLLIQILWLFVTDFVAAEGLGRRASRKGYRAPQRKQQQQQQQNTANHDDTLTKHRYHARRRVSAHGQYIPDYYNNIPAVDNKSSPKNLETIMQRIGDKTEEEEWTENQEDGDPQITSPHQPGGRLQDFSLLDREQQPIISKGGGRERGHYTSTRSSSKGGKGGSYNPSDEYYHDFSFNDEENEDRTTNNETGSQNNIIVSSPPTTTQPSVFPTKVTTNFPTFPPTALPTALPTSVPTFSPTVTLVQTQEPTITPAQSSSSSSAVPTVVPTGVQTSADNNLPILPEQNNNNSTGGEPTCSITNNNLALSPFTVSFTSEAIINEDGLSMADYLLNEMQLFFGAQQLSSIELERILGREEDDILYNIHYPSGNALVHNNNCSNINNETIITEEILHQVQEIILSNVSSLQEFLQLNDRNITVVDISILNDNDNNNGPSTNEFIAIEDDASRQQPPSSQPSDNLILILLSTIIPLVVLALFIIYCLKRRKNERDYR